MFTTGAVSRSLTIGVPGGTIAGDLEVPAGASGIVVFAHGSGSSRFSTRNRFVAGKLRERGSGTFLLDLLTEEEEARDRFTREYRFDIDLLAERLVTAIRTIADMGDESALPIGSFGSSTGAAAALIAAARLGPVMSAVVSRGGRPDLAGHALAAVAAPVLLIVGGRDLDVIVLNRLALQQLTCEKELVVVEGATHLFEEPGTLEKVADLAGEWFSKHFQRHTEAAQTAQ